MEHSYASEHHVVEQYLLGELSPDQRDEFEEHFFDCQLCASELKLTSAFLETARSQLRQPEFAAAAQPSSPRTWGVLRDLFRWPAVATAALAASLSVVAYQNVVTLPVLRNEVAQMDVPAVVPTISLVGGNSRGGNVPSVASHAAKTVLLQVDIPTHEGLGDYICTLESPKHEVVWTVHVSPEAAKDTVTLRAPLGTHPESGVYTLGVKGSGAPGASAHAEVDLAMYYFNLYDGAAKSGQ